MAYMTSNSPKHITYEIISASTKEMIHQLRSIDEIAILKVRILDASSRDGPSTSFINKDLSFSSPPVSPERVIEQARKEIKIHLENGNIYILARDTQTNKGIGYGLFELGKEEKIMVARLEEAFVRQDWRKQGIFSQLVEIGEEAARQRGINAIRVYVEKDSNSKRVLEKKGYYVVESFEGGAEVMIKVLNTVDSERTLSISRV